MRSYGQYCSVAKALDVIGDRWTLLIIRELLLRGACRYTDLKNGLPGIATNLLADRIRELESAGLVRREDAPPPVATTLVHLTESGAELEPVIKALGWWGLRYMAGPADTDEFRSQWFTYPVDFFLRDRDPDGPPASIELRAGADPAVVEVSGGAVRVRVGSVPNPDLVLAGRPQLIDALFTGQLTAAEVVAYGLEISGDTGVLDRVLPGPEDAYQSSRQPEPTGGKRCKPARSTLSTRPDCPGRASSRR
jgi:DNA-binding HxlR family transcriptional regulator